MRGIALLQCATFSLSPSSLRSLVVMTDYLIGEGRVFESQLVHKVYFDICDASRYNISGIISGTQNLKAYTFASMAYWLARWSVRPVVVGSNPTACNFFMV